MSRIRPNGTLAFCGGSTGNLGSSARLADSSGTQVKAIWYQPFGAAADEQGDATARYRYTGKQRDDSGLYYYGARYYDEQLGRFLAADSVLPDVYDPQQLNRFAYVRNNPIKLVDPDGHAAIAAIVLGAFVYSYFMGTTIVVAGVITISAGAIISYVAGEADKDDESTDENKEDTSEQTDEGPDGDDGEPLTVKTDTDSTVTQRKWRQVIDLGDGITATYEYGYLVSIDSTNKSKKGRTLLDKLRENYIGSHIEDTSFGSYDDSGAVSGPASMREVIGIARAVDISTRKSQIGPARTEKTETKTQRR